MVLVEETAKKCSSLLHMYRVNVSLSYLRNPSDDARLIHSSAGLGHSALGKGDLAALIISRKERSSSERRAEDAPAGLKAEVAVSRILIALKANPHVGADGHLDGDRLARVDAVKGQVDGLVGGDGVAGAGPRDVACGAAADAGRVEEGGLVGDGQVVVVRARVDEAGCHLAAGAARVDRDAVGGDLGGGHVVADAALLPGVGDLDQLALVLGGVDAALQAASSVGTTHVGRGLVEPQRLDGRIDTSTFEQVLAEGWAGRVAPRLVVAVVVGRDAQDAEIIDRHRAASARAADALLQVVHNGHCRIGALGGLSRAVDEVEGLVDGNVANVDLVQTTICVEGAEWHRLRCCGGVRVVQVVPGWDRGIARPLAAKAGQAPVCNGVRPKHEEVLAALVVDHLKCGVERGDEHIGRGLVVGPEAEVERNVYGRHSLGDRRANRHDHQNGLHLESESIKTSDDYYGNERVRGGLHKETLGLTGSISFM